MSHFTVKLYTPPGMCSVSIGGMTVQPVPVGTLGYGLIEVPRTSQEELEGHGLLLQLPAEVAEENEESLESETEEVVVLAPKKQRAVVKGKLNFKAKK